MWKAGRIDVSLVFAQLASKIRAQSHLVKKEAGVAEFLKTL